jgi:arylsulfatase A-like enzyme
MMTRRTFLKAVGLGAAATAGMRSGVSAPAAGGGNRPNVVLVLTDDQGYGDLSGHGNPVLKTPYLDALRTQSIRFTDFHVAPMCTPTRGQVLTGRDAMANGATFVCLGRSMMRHDLPTMAEIFAAGGYRTGHFGKWHLGDSYPHRPQDRGFQETVHHGAWGITSIADHFGNDYYDDTYRHNGKREKYTGYCTDVWFDEAMKYMRKRQAAGEPFFVYLPTNCPHSPHWVAEKYAAPYKRKGLPAPFFGQIANIDENMGRLIAMLDETKLAEDTILIFMTDNGTVRGEKVFNAGMRGKKTQLWEGGHRVPCYVRWPAGKLGRPRDIDELTECQDMLPTLIDLCGLKAPRGMKLDGVSLAGLLRGTGEHLADRMLVIQYGASPRKGAAAVLWRKWRLVNDRQLYDVAADPHQDKDVAAEHSDVVRKMREHYAAWWKRTRPEFERVRYIRLGSEKANPMMLYSSDWVGSYADNFGNLAAGNGIGRWHVIVEKAGTYEFTLRRWAPEADTPLAASLAGPMGKGKAVPIAEARLRIGGVDLTSPAPGGAKAVSFTVNLEAGKTLLETWFHDKAGKPLCSAYYTRAERK